MKNILFISILFASFVYSLELLGEDSIPNSENSSTLTTPSPTPVVSQEVQSSTSSTDSATEAPITLESSVQPSPSPAPKTVIKSDATEPNGISFVLGGSIYLALENWSRVGESGDSKMGAGFGGAFGAGLKVDDMKVIIGPQMSVNRWSADYSQKSQSATSSVYVEMADAGISLMTTFDDFYLNMGTGSSTISSGMTVNGTEVKYTYDGDHYTYNLVELGLLINKFMLGFGFVSYSGYAKYCDRGEFIFGYSF